MQIDVIPAQPGLRVIERYDDFYEDGDIVIDIGLPIIAWRIQTGHAPGLYESLCIPLTVIGDVNHPVGVLNADGSVSSNEQHHYANLDDFMADCYPNAKLINTTEEKRIGRKSSSVI